MRRCELAMEDSPEMPTESFRVVAEIALPVEGSATVYEHGWQSWSPAGVYSATLPTSPRPRRPEWQTMAFRPGRPAPATGFQSEGLIAIATDDQVRTWVTPDPTTVVPSIRVERIDDRLIVSADGLLDERPRTATLEASLTDLATTLAGAAAPGRARPLGPGWCSWYGYGPDVTDEVIQANLAVIDSEDLDVRVVQIDDGHQAGIGDWLEPSGRIESMAAAATRITAGGREAGVWTAPFMVGATSRLARAHPGWLVKDAVAAQHHWGQEVRVLDVTHPDAADHLSSIFRTLRAWGFSFHKLDFLYAGAMPGGRYRDGDPIAVYREGLRLIREAIGNDATILGCGAPLLPSIGLVDAMRVSPDTDRRREPPDGDVSQPSMRSALAAGRARAWMHGRLWVNDPDCLIVDPDSDDRYGWAGYVESSRALVMSGDRLPELDADGLALTRRILRPAGPGPVA